MKSVEWGEEKNDTHDWCSRSRMWYVDVLTIVESMKIATFDHELFCKSPATNCRCIYVSIQYYISKGRWLRKYIEVKNYKLIGE